MYPHRIRLRGPWECEPVAHTLLRADGRIETLSVPPPASCRMTIPCRWREGGLGEFAGRVRFRRRFGYPGRLDPHDRAWLTFAGVDYFAEVFLNGERLGEHEGSFGTFRFEVTPLLQSRNELIVEVECPDVDTDARACSTLARGEVPSGNGGIWGEVTLEVCCPAHLEGLRLWATWPTHDVAHLHLSTHAVGTATRPLELYVLVGGRTLLYAPGVMPTPEGTPLAHTVEVPSPALWWPRNEGDAHLISVRIDLIDGGALWWRGEKAFGFRTIEPLDGTTVRINGRAVALSRLEGSSGNFLGTYPAGGVLEGSGNVYDHCDRQGILLMQGMPVAPGSEPATAREARALLGRLQHHASIIGWTWPRVEETLDAGLSSVVAAVDPSRTGLSGSK